MQKGPRFAPEPFVLCSHLRGCLDPRLRGDDEDLRGDDETLCSP